MRCPLTRCAFTCTILLSMAFVASEPPASAEARRTSGRAAVATRRGAENRAVFTIPWRGKLEITASGRATLRSSKGTRRFRLQFDDPLDYLKRLYYRKVGTDLLLIGELELDDGGAGFVTRLDSRELRQRWSLWIPAFNVGPALIDGSFAYVSAHGFVGKVNLDAGHYDWQHVDLYEQDQSFNRFDVPRFEGGNVVFTSLGPWEPDGARLVVDRDTGKLLERRTIYSRPPS